MPRIQLLVVQPTPFCNIDCRYCYLPDRTNKAVVAEATLANLFSQVFASGWVRDGVTIVWHAGEPMVLPIDFYRRAFRLIDGLKPAGVALSHSFQTNGTLIDDAWCEFFAAELRVVPWQAVLDTWMLRLAPGISAAATHGAIRVGHAVRALSREETPARRRELGRSEEHTSEPVTIRSRMPSSA